MLQLLLERGQSYDDLASVLGVDEAEVRARARATLTELAGADPDRHVALTDYLLGQADPIGRADAVRHLKDDPADLELATEIAQKIRLIAPDAELPRLPGEERRPRPRRDPSASSRLPIPERLRRGRPPQSAAGADAAPARTTLSRRQTQLAVGLGSSAVLALVVILGVSGAFGGGDGDGTTTTATTNGGAETRITLRPQSGASGSGTVTIGLNPGDSQPYVDVALDKLRRPPQGQTYVVWFLLTGERGYPIVPVSPCGEMVPQPCLTENGSFRDRIAIQPEVLPVVARVRVADVSIAPIEEINKAISRAFQNQEIIFKRPGTTVLRGAIPRARNRGAGDGAG